MSLGEGKDLLLRVWGIGCIGVRVWWFGCFALATVCGLTFRSGQSRFLGTHTILYYTILYYTILYYTILYYTILYYLVAE